MKDRSQYMKEKNPSHAKLTLAHYFLFLLLFAALFASYKMVAPYLGPIILALIFAAMANPVYQWFVEKTKGRENLSAALVCLLLTLLIVVPCMIMLSVIIAQGIDSVEAINRWVAAGNLAKLKEAALVKTAVGLMHRYLPPDFLEVAVLEVRQLPLPLAEGVVALRVLPEEGQRDLLPQPHSLEGIEGQLFGGDQQAVPALIGQ